MAKLISVKTCDDVVFEIEPSLAKNMKALQPLVDEDGAKVSVAPLPNVSSNHMTMIMEYHRLSDAGKVKEFSVEKLDNEELKDFLLAVHYLDLEALFEFLTLAVANRIENRSVRYVREYFGIQNDFTPEEEAAVREKNAWTFKGEGIEPEE
ncbi:SKP1-like protein 14 [Vicia villosa]|uniref:SKP1-like protein 14 n=1 Tax=Vicia villosa TaxID=3911 RepID=UPI00273BAD7E|nr:SKP1-like protein 14 [Vicia villosa]